MTDVLRERIVEGELPPGTPLRDVALSAELGVSRNTLREAQRTLHDEGRAVQRLHKGTAVKTLSAEDDGTSTSPAAPSNSARSTRVRSPRNPCSTPWRPRSPRPNLAVDAEAWTRSAPRPCASTSRTGRPWPGSARLDGFFRVTIAQLRLAFAVMADQGGLQQAPWVARDRRDLRPDPGCRRTPAATAALRVYLDDSERTVLDAVRASSSYGQLPHEQCDFGSERQAMTSRTVTGAGAAPAAGQEPQPPTRRARGGAATSTVAPSTTGPGSPGVRHELVDSFEIPIRSGRPRPDRPCRDTCGPDRHRRGPPGPATSTRVEPARTRANACGPRRTRQLQQARIISTLRPDLWSTCRSSAPPAHRHRRHLRTTWTRTAADACPPRLLLGTSVRDPYVNRMLTGEDFDFHCLPRTWSGPYCRTGSPSSTCTTCSTCSPVHRPRQRTTRPVLHEGPPRPRVGDHFEFFAETDLLCALSTCPGAAICSSPCWGPDASADPLDGVCRPRWAIGVPASTPRSLAGWTLAPARAVRWPICTGRGGPKFPSGE
ncbi:GntR family transcriptional regulator [Streptomyces sp. L7]